MQFAKKIIQNLRKHKNIDTLNEAFNKTMKEAEGILTLQEPTIYAMNEESNIASKFSDKYIATQDGNLCAGFRIEGISYSAITLNQEIELVNTRNRFWSKLDTNVEVNIFAKKEKIHLEFDSSSPNHFAEEIIKK